MPDDCHLQYSQKVSSEYTDFEPVASSIEVTRFFSRATLVSVIYIIVFVRAIAYGNDLHSHFFSFLFNVCRAIRNHTSVSKKWLHAVDQPS